MIKMSVHEQTSYVFIPGKNWKLSLAELVSFFKARECKFKVTSLSKSFFVVTSEEALDSSLIDNLGGIIKLGRVISQIPSETIEDAFLHRKKQAQAEIKANLSANCDIKEIFKTPQEKFVFGVSIYFENPRFLQSSREMQRFLGSYFKKELAAYGKKAKFMGFPKDRKLPQLTHVEVLKKGLLEKSAEILVCIDREKAFISHTIAVHNPFEFQKRDINRPMQRKIFSMPPRLAKIMVTLSLCLPGKVLLDPFCGVGTILQEAMLIKAHVIGVDINPWCVKASCTNLDWLKKEYNLTNVRHKVFLGDARNSPEQIKDETIDCVVTEPDLGPALRHFPTELYAQRVVDKLKPLYYDFLEEAYKVLKRSERLVLVTPYIKTRAGAFVSLNIEEKAKANGFEIVRPFERKTFANCSLLIENLIKTSAFIDIEKRHKIGREIHVFQK